MTFADMKTQHPSLYSALLEEHSNEAAARDNWEALLAQSRAEGTAQERARIQTHIAIGRKSGAADIANAAIAAGIAADDEDIIFKYLSRASDPYSARVTFESSFAEGGN